MMYFLGVGLISGSIVHLTIDPVRYSIILIIGAFLFAIASFISEMSKKGQNMKSSEIVRVVFFSLVLSLGIGMISGGIQHFSDLGIYATYLIPIGFVLSIFGYIYTNNTPLTRIQWGFIFILLLVISLPLKGFLNYEVHKNVGSVSSDSGHDHSHSNVKSAPKESGHDENSESVSPESGHDELSESVSSELGHDEHSESVPSESGNDAESHTHDGHTHDLAE